MKRHTFDSVSFLFGLVFGGVAAVYLAAPSLEWDVAGPWLFPVALMVLGLAAIVGAVGGLRPRRDDAASDPRPDEVDAVDATVTQQPSEPESPGTKPGR